MKPTSIMRQTAAWLILFTLFACDKASEPAPNRATAAPLAIEKVEKSEKTPKNQPKVEKENKEIAATATPKRIFAKRVAARIRSGAACDAPRIGYLRAGAVMTATTSEPLGEAKCCKNGEKECRPRHMRRCQWWALKTGGFVCGRLDVIAFEGKKLPQVTGRRADRDAELPYQYGFVRRDAPLYKKIPTDEEAAQFEDYVIPGSEPIAATESENGEPAGKTADAKGKAAPAKPATKPIAASAPAPAAETAQTNTTGLETEEPVITLDSLTGDPDSVLLRRMMRGFYVSLDRDFRKGSRRYWRTQGNGFIPYRSIVVKKLPSFHGYPLAEGQSLPGIFVMKKGAAKYNLDEKNRVRRARGKVDFRHFFANATLHEDKKGNYYKDAEGMLFRERDSRVVELEQRPSDIPADVQWIDINLKKQTLVAYEGDKPVYVTLISSGKANKSWKKDAEDWETPTGTFQIKSKHVTHTMDGDTAVDGPYSVDDVPYVMYFQLAYALHGAFWHNGFGYPKSHGCVNLAPRDAKWIFNWAGPTMDKRWHMAASTKEAPGAWLHIHGTTRGAK